MTFNIDLQDSYKDASSSLESFICRTDNLDVVTNNVGLSGSIRGLCCMNLILAISDAASGTNTLIPRLASKTYELTVICN